jgi:hypothetical protein
LSWQSRKISTFSKSCIDESRNLDLDWSWLSRPPKLTCAERRNWSIFGGESEFVTSVDIFSFFCLFLSFLRVFSSVSVFLSVYIVCLVLPSICLYRCLCLSLHVKCLLLCLMVNLKSICLSMLINYLRLLVCIAVFVCPKTPINSFI